MSFGTRGWLFASRSMDLLRDEIDLAARYGVNHIQLSHSLVHYAEQVLQSAVLREHIAELIDRAHRHGIEVAIWTHELQNVPQEFMVGGKVDLASRHTWDQIAHKYDELFESLPGLDGVVLTLTETRVRIDDDNEVAATRPPVQRIARMVSMINQVCRKHGARLIVRTFTWVPRTMLWYAEAMRSVPDDVMVMTKESWGDWYQYSPPNQQFGLYGRHPQIMELDCWGEYAGRTEIPWISADYIRSRLEYAQRMGLAGAIARVDRAERSTFGTPNEFNTVAFSRLVQDMTVDLDRVWTEWLERTYSPEAAGSVRRALERTNEIIQRIYFTRGIKGATTPTPTLVDVEAESTIRFWRDFHGQWEPEMAVRGEQLLDPTEETVISLVSEKDRAISLCDQALADLETARSHMDEHAFERLRTGFEHARALAVASRAMTEAVYLHKLLEREPTPARREWFEHSGQTLLATAHDIEHTYGKGFSLIRPEALRDIWRAAENIHSGRVAWSVPLGLYVAASPAVGDVGRGGLPMVVAVSSHKEIVGLSGDGRRLWTTTTLGQRYEYPHFSSPIIVTDRASGEARVFAGAADGRLYCLDADGRIVWQHAMGNRIDAAPAVADVDNDGREEIVVASLDGTVACLDASGGQRWRVDLHEPIFATPALTPTNEIIVATLQGTIACLGADGHSCWQRAVKATPVPPRQYGGVPDGRAYALSEGGPNAVYASPLVTDLQGDGQMDIIIGAATGHLMVYDMRGEVRWEAACGGSIYSSPTVIAAGTPHAHVIVGSDDWRVHAIDTTGRTIWQFDTNGPVRSSPVVVPEHYAGVECIVVGSYDHNVYVIDADGREIDEYLTGGAIFGAPAVADVNGDGRAEIIVGSYDHRLYAFRTSWQVPRGGIIAGCFRGNPRRQGV